MYSSWLYIRGADKVQGADSVCVMADLRESNKDLRKKGMLLSTHSSSCFGLSGV